MPKLPVRILARACYGLLTACCLAAFAIASRDLYRAGLGVHAELFGAKWLGSATVQPFKP